MYFYKLPVKGSIKIIPEWWLVEGIDCTVQN